ncbi:glutathione S-transferase 1-like [Trichoplusia ni]|uniref:Glutathione S-transferase 1-like n=1 Tax=Trichoplusia ni TaxID=7111 RepID=A0A7E5VLP0_TRINI|nr:glutathione S-transferase 1-like [Trichoplusia ni]
MSIIIHKTAVSPPARATLMLTKILGLNVETREVQLPTREQFKPAYLMKNPMHTVPLLEDGGFVLADSHAIMTYLTSKYGGTKQELYPKDVAARAIVDQRLYFDASILFPHLRSVINKVVKSRAPGLTTEQIADIEESYYIADKYLEATRYVAGDVLSLADISCVATISSLNSIIEIDEKYVKLREWWALLQKEDWYQKENEPGLRLFDGFIKKFL